MNCEQYRLLLHDLLDGSLPDQTARTMAAHEAECPECAAYRAEMYALLQTLHTLDEDVEPPASFGSAWRQAVHAEARTRRRQGHRWQRFAAVAAALVCLIGGTTLLRAGRLPWVPESLAKRYASQNAESEGDFILTTPGTGGPYAKYDAGPRMESGSLGQPHDLDDSSASMAGASEDLEMVSEEDALLFSAPDASEKQPSPRGGMKVLRSGYFHLTTASFEDDLAVILNMTNEIGGWVEYQSVNGESLRQNPDAGRYGSLTLRIPATALDEFVAELSGIGRLQSSELSAQQDLTDRYHEQQARLTQYEAQRDRLEELRKAPQSVADIIQIEERLAEVLYEIDTLTGILENWDDRAQYAQVTVSLQEIAESTQPLATDASLGARIRDGMGRSLEFLGSFLRDMAVFLVVIAPWLLIVGLITTILVAIRRRRRR